MRTFATVVQAGSMSAAARLLGMSPSGVSKQLERLERRLGVRLLVRSTRSLMLTEEGSRYHRGSVEVLERLAEVERGVASRSDAATGVLRVSCTVAFGQRRVVPLLAEFLERNPGLSVDLSTSDRMVDLRREPFEVAIRTGILTDSSFRARRIAQSRRVVVAAPSYLERTGTPRRPSDLARHTCLDFDFRRGVRGWPFSLRGGQIVTVAGNLTTDDGETMRQLTLAGLGVSRLSAYHVEGDLAERRLVTVLERYNPGDLEDIHAVYHAHRPVPARVRAFVGFLAAKLARP